MPATLVRPTPSVTMRPLSSLTPSASSPRPSTLPTTPTAEIRRSAAMLSRLPSPCSMVAVMPSLPRLTSPTLAPVMMRMPSFSNALRASAAISASSAGRISRQQLDDRHLDAERAIERGELDADGAGAGDEQRARQRRRQHGLEVGPDALAVGLHAGQRARARTGGDDDVRGGVAAGAERILRRIGVLSSAFRRAPQHRSRRRRAALPCPR